MAIKVVGLGKSFGGFQALKDINFEINTGEIVGLLGPNGAGKSTLMKILSGVIPSNLGEVSICGFDLNSNSLNTRMNIGYLPESNPLYLNMYIKEYLEFSAGFYKLGKERDDRINEMIKVTGLDDYLKKKIGVLSKGLKQRVGLSQALLHDPRVLILDEPTSGLDPNQIIEIRNLILSLGKNKTILFSSHIMQEVEAVCERLIILNKGQIINDIKTVDINKISYDKNIVEIEFDGEVNREMLLSLSFVEDVVKLSTNKWRIEPVEKSDIRKDLMAFSVSHDLSILSLNQQSDSLETIFQKLTKKD